MPKPRSKLNQRGAGSDYMASFYANTAVGGPAAITRAGLQVIDQAPMFNPLGSNTVVPTQSSGVIPTGLYLAGTQTGGGCGCGVGGGAQTGGGRGQVGGYFTNKALNKLKADELRELCNKLGMSCINPKTGAYLTKSVLITKILTSPHLPSDD